MDIGQIVVFVFLFTLAIFLFGYAFGVRYAIGIVVPVCLVGLIIALQETGAISSDQGENFLVMAAAVIFGSVAILVVYFLPSLIALNRKHINKGPIMIVNVFLGWTLIGWVAALVWSTAAQP